MFNSCSRAAAAAAEAADKEHRRRRINSVRLRRRTKMSFPLVNVLLSLFVAGQLRLTEVVAESTQQVRLTMATL